MHPWKSSLLIHFTTASLSLTVRANHFASSADEIRTSLSRAIEAIEKEYGAEYPGEQFKQRLEALPAEDLAG